MTQACDVNDILIITGGEVDAASLLQYIRGKIYNRIIAVDGGLNHCHAVGILPDIVIGDFDTVDERLLKEYEKKGCELVRLSPIKDDTDTEASYLKALEFKPQNIDIFGAIGSRFDHSYSNVFLLKRGMRDGVRVQLITAISRVSLIWGKVVVEKSSLYGKYVSLIQFDGGARGVTLKGFAYEVENFDFDTSKTFRLGVSNELSCDIGHIQIDEGCMLLIESKEDKANDKA